MSLLAKAPATTFDSPTGQCPEPLIGGPFVVAGLGSALPQRRVTNDELAARLNTSDEWIRSRSGIIARRRAGVEETTTALAATALRRALAEADMLASDLDVLIVATSTPDSPCPSTAARVAAEVGSTAEAFDLNGACAGFVQAVRVAAALITGPGVSAVAIVGADRFSTLPDPDDRATAVLFGDGAGAVIIRGSDPSADTGLLGFDGGGDPAGLGAVQVPLGGHHLCMDGPSLFRSATLALVQSSTSALGRSGMSADDVDLFVPHQANARIISAVGERLGIDPARTVVDLAERANTSAASIPLALNAARNDGRLPGGGIVLLSGVGAGLGWASAVIRWSR